MQNNNKQQKKKNASQKKEKRLVQAQAMVENTFRLGHCAGLYAHSLADPFTGPPEACLPVSPSIMSSKQRVFIRGQMATSSTDGRGFIVAQPWAANDNGSTTVGGAPIYYSSATWVPAAGVAIPALSTATAGINVASTNSPYTRAFFGVATGGIQARLVSFGMRIRYAGTELNRGGRVLLFEDPEHNGFDPLQPVAISTILANEKAKEHKVGEDWLTLCSTGPTQPNEYDFLGTYQPPTGLASFYLMAVVQSAAVGQTFDYEVFWNWEFAGSPVRGKTYSESDDQGVSVVLGAIKSVNNNQLDSSHPLIKSTNSKNAKVIGTTVAQLAQTYAAKNTSGWITKTIRGIEKFGKNALPYLEKGLEVGGALAPLLL
jgi:hypothetical protein